MEQFKMKKLNKIDDPYSLLVWSEIGRDQMTIRKISEDGFIIIEVEKWLSKLSDLSPEEKKEAIQNIPTEIEREIIDKLDIKGSLPYEIRDWVWSVIHNIQKNSQ